MASMASRLRTTSSTSRSRFGVTAKATMAVWSAVSFSEAAGSTVTKFQHDTSGTPSATPARRYTGCPPGSVPRAYDLNHSFRKRPPW